MSLIQIKRHWDRASAKVSLSGRTTPTSRDPFLAQIERNRILEYLGPNQVVVEIGCGDGIHTLHYASRVKQLWGMDVSKNMTRLARKRAASERVPNVGFMAGSVLELDAVLGRAQVDTVISQRCIINLPTWKDQRKAILAIHKLLRRGGLFLMTEGFQDELENLNRIRHCLGLSSIQVVGYNRNLTHRQFDPLIKRFFTLEAVHDYGCYLVLSRVHHPLTVRPRKPKHVSPLNRSAYLLSNVVCAPGWRPYSYNLFYVLRKK